MKIFLFLLLVFVSFAQAEPPQPGPLASSNRKPRQSPPAEAVAVNNRVFVGDPDVIARTSFAGADSRPIQQI